MSPEDSTHDSTEHVTPPTPTTWVTPPVPDAPPVARSRWQRSRLWVGAGALVLAGLGGGVAIGAAAHSSGADGHPRAGNAALPPGYGNGNGFPGGARDGGGNGRPGGEDGEQHVTGTISAVTSSAITVKTASGSSTYQATSSTQILRNGTRATLAQLKTGDPVEVHVFSGGTVERILAGTLPQRPEN